MVVGEDAQLAREALALALHMGRAGHGQAEAALGPLGQPVEFVVREPAIGVALQVGERGQDEPVLQGGATGEGDLEAKPLQGFDRMAERGVKHATRAIRDRHQHRLLLVRAIRQSGREHGKVLPRPAQAMI